MRRLRIHRLWSIASHSTLSARGYGRDHSEHTRYIAACPLSIAPDVFHRCADAKQQRQSLRSSALSQLGLCTRSLHLSLMVSPTNRKLRYRTSTAELV